MNLLTSSTIAVLWMLCDVKGNDFERPRQLSSISGDTVRMECNRTVDGTVDWKVDYDPDGTLAYICNNGRLTDRYRPRVELDPHNYTLTINDVMANDSGLYYCVDNVGRHDFTRLEVVILPPGHVGLVNRTETSLAMYFNQTGRVTGYSVSVNGQTTSGVTYSGIGRNIVTAVVHDLIPGSRYSVSVWSSRYGIHSKTSTTANYSTVPEAPGDLDLVNATNKCLTISWNQRGRVTSYEVMLDDSCPLNTKYIGVGTEFVTAVLCCLSIETRYKVSITAVSDEDISQAASGYFETLPRPYSAPVMTIVVSVLVPTVCLATGCVVAYVVYRRLQDIQPVVQQQRSFIEFNQSSLTETIAVVWDGFMDRLQKQKCITDRERRLIASRNDHATETRQLFDVLKYSRRREFNIFIRCLQQIDQRQLASVVAAGEGVIVGVDLEVTTGSQSIAPLKSVNPRQLFTPNSITQMQSAMNLQLGSDVLLISILTHNVTRAHFHCKTVMGLHLFDELCVSGQLTTMLQQAIIGVGSDHQQLSISRLTWSTDAYLRCVRYLHQQQDLLRDIYKLCPHKEIILTNHFDASKGEQFQYFEMKGIGHLEVVIMKAAVQFFKVFSKLSGGSDAISFTVLSAVCQSWWMILANRHLKTPLRQQFDRVCYPYCRNPQLVEQLNASCNVRGVTQMGDKIFVVCRRSDKIRVFGQNNVQEDDITVRGLERPEDIVACSETRSLYVADRGWSLDCVRRTSTDGQIQEIIAISKLWKLSLTSGRLLVTTFDALLLFGADGVEPKRLSFTDMTDIRHAVETSRGTFVFCHTKPRPQIVEVDGDGQTISVFDNQLQLDWPCHLSLDSEDRVFITDCNKHRVILLTSDLQLDRVLVDTEHNQLLREPCRMFYVQQTGQLRVASWLSPVIQVFAVG